MSEQRCRPSWSTFVRGIHIMKHLLSTVVRVTPGLHPSQACQCLPNRYPYLQRDQQRVPYGRAAISAPRTECTMENLHIAGEPRPGTEEWRQVEATTATLRASVASCVLRDLDNGPGLCFWRSSWRKQHGSKNWTLANWPPASITAQRYSARQGPCCRTLRAGRGCRRCRRQSTALFDLVNLLIAYAMPRLLLPIRIPDCTSNAHGCALGLFAGLNGSKKLKR